MKVWLGALLLIAAGCSNARYDTGFTLETYSQAVSIPGLPLIAQSENYQCGYACVASVAIYCGVASDKLIAEDVSDRFGGMALSGREMIELAKTLGLTAYVYQGDHEDIAKNLRKGRPLVALLDHPPRTADWPTYEWAYETAEWSLVMPHWVVVIGMTPEGNYLIHDPRKGRLQMSREEFTNEWQKSSRLSVLICPAPD